MRTLDKATTIETSLHRNPFRVIGATPRDNRARIIELADEAGLIGDIDICREAQGTLIHPRRRLAAEMGWLPGVAPAKASKLVDHIANAAVREAAGELTPLARANILASYIETLDTSVATADAAQAILRLALAAEAVDPNEVLRDINEERAVAGFTLEREPHAVAEEYEVRTRDYKICITRLLNRLEPEAVVKIVNAFVERCTKDGQQPAPTLIHGLLETYEFDVQAFVERETENVQKLVARARDMASGGEACVLPVVEELERVVENYLSVIRPILLVNKPIGLSHAPTRAVAFEIRGLSITLHNENGFIDAPSRLTSFLKDRFAIVDEVAEPVAEDDTYLRGAIEKRRQAEVEREEYEREITYSAEVGLLFKDKISISPAGLVWKDRRMPVEEITRLRWGGTRHSVNGIPTGSDFMIMVGDSLQTINISMRNKEVYLNVTDRIWRSAGVRLLLQTVARLSEGEAVTFGNAILRDGSIGLVRHKVWGADERVDLGWDEVRVWSADGKFLVGSRSDKKVYVALSYQEVDNVHVIENLIRTFFKKSVPKISQMFG